MHSRIGKPYRAVSAAAFLVLVVVLLFIAVGSVAAQAPNVTLTVNDSNGSPLPDVKVYYNDYGNHWVLLGNTSDNNPVTATFADGSYKFKAVKEYSEQVANVTVSGSGSFTFQTAKFTVHVNDSTGANYPGIAASYNDYGNHYVKMGVTDSNGDAFIELFPGTYKFKAAKDYSAATGTTSAAISFQTAKFTVHVDDSTGANYPGIAASYNDYGTHYLSMGTTDSNGDAFIELFPGTYKFRAYKDHTEETGDLTNDTAGTVQTIDFQTAKAIGIVKDCDGTPLAGFKVAFNDYGNHWLAMGTTAGDGKASIELFPGVRKIRAWKDYTFEVKDLTLALTESTVEFNPTKIDWQYSGTIKYNDYGSHWKTMTSPFYLFPGTYDFKFDGVQTSVTISGCEMAGSVLLITLKDSSGAGVENGYAQLGVGGWPGIGTTDANGNLVYFYDGILGNMRIRMKAPFYGGTETSPVQDTAVNSMFNFQTQQVTIQLKDSVGTLTDGGLVRAGVGGWPSIGSTGDDGPGTLYHEHFAGTFKYRMTFNGTTEEQQHDVSTPFIFQTVQAVIQLKDHLGNPLDGGVVRFGIGGWPVIGTTGDDAAGETHHELFAGSYNFRMIYNHASEQKGADISSAVVFQTALVDLQFSGTIKHKVGGWPAYVKPTEMLPVSQGYGFSGCGYPGQTVFFTPAAGTVFAKSIVFADLKDSGGGGLAGGDFEYRFGWGSYAPMGTTPASGLLVYAIDGLQTNTKFRVSYAGGTTGDKQQNIAHDSCVNFQTVPVTAVLNDSGGSPLGGAVYKYRYGWGPKMTFDGAEELLPINTKITIYYMGASIEKQQNANSNPNFVFVTVPVTAALEDSGGSPLGGAAFEYRYGWGSKLPFSGPMELLPVNTKITVHYLGALIEKQQNANSNPDFLFTTVSVTAVLNNSANSAALPGVFEYRYDWGVYVPFSGPKEMLPVNTKMRVKYAGGVTADVLQNVGSNSHFAWQTGTVASGTAVSYRYGWGSDIVFNNGMELLPLATKFKFSGGIPPEMTKVIVSGVVNTVP